MEVLFGLGDEGIYLVPHFYLINGIHTQNHLTKINVFIGERLTSGVSQTDKKLGIVTLFFDATSGQANGSSLKGNLINFGLDSTASGAITLGVTPLNHKTGFDSMEGETIVKTGVDFI